MTHEVGSSISRGALAGLDFFFMYLFIHLLQRVELWNVTRAEDNPAEDRCELVRPTATPCQGYCSAMNPPRCPASAGEQHR